MAERERKKLPRTKQCAKCPWKVSTNPHDIPNGYSQNKHKNLRKTIADGLQLDFSQQQHAMACHESKLGRETYCIGWLMNQLGPGNNIPLRWKMLDYDLSNIKLDGEQHERFEDTLP